MWPLIMAAARSYAPYITLPFAAVVGFIGYNIEGYFRKDTPWRELSTQEERDERRLGELEKHDATDVDSLKLKKDMPRTVLDRNSS